MFKQYTYFLQEKKNKMQDMYIYYIRIKAVIIQSKLVKDIILF